MSQLKMDISACERPDIYEKLDILTLSKYDSVQL